MSLKNRALVPAEHEKKRVQSGSGIVSQLRLRKSRFNAADLLSGRLRFTYRVSWPLGLLLGLLAVGLMVAARPVSAQPSPLHPQFPLLDAQGNHVLDSGRPVSTLQTCGGCHDTAFIAEHSFHSDAGLSEMGEGFRPWDLGPGYFGRWDPLTYRYLSPADADVVDLTTPEWLMTYGVRHVGGGPAALSRGGAPLTALTPTNGSVQSAIHEPLTGDLVAWDWKASGTVEMNCFLCHTAEPNNETRVAALEAGNFGWANSVTLFGSGVIQESDDGWQWNPAAFDDEGLLLEPFVQIQDPTSDNCGACHGTVHTDNQTPLTVDYTAPDAWRTLTTGQIVSPQTLNRSGLNLADKPELDRAWDVHAERVLDCTSCHYALNNPVFYREEDGPEHLEFDPRRLDLGEYLYRPLHEFAKGQSATSGVAAEFDNTIRRCESCHTMDAGHEWLPYREEHAQALACETCHVPQIYAPAVQSVDWTVLYADGAPATTFRGVEGGALTEDALVEGYRPVLLPRDNGDGTTALAPHNLLSAWYWVYGAQPRPVPLAVLEGVYFDEDGIYRPAIVDTFDADGDGQVTRAELFIDSDDKEAAIAAELADRGLDGARIMADIQPYTINHDVATGEWATRECSVCHSEESTLTAAFDLAGRVPGGVVPALIDNPSSALNGEVVMTDEGRLVYRPETLTGDVQQIYVLGRDSVGWIDLLGALLFVGVVLGVSVHGGARTINARRRESHEPRLRRVYMYSVYERFWHWLQTGVILGLLFTGLVIHKPDIFGIFSFPFAVQVHNVLAAILVINAALALFYHLASGEIQQYLPRPQGFFSDAIQQSLFYVRGIFRGEPHPFEKTRDRKLNPLQQMTYFAILNVLLPLQVITGALMWGAQTWPDVAARLGGLPFLAPFHTLISWLFAAFIVLHVYLTTTGHKPTAAIKAMMVGWDDVEVHGEPAEGDESPPAAAPTA